MTAAGVGSILLCNRQLETYRKPEIEVSKLLTPLGPSIQKVKYKPATTPAEVNSAAKRGLSWIAQTFNPSTNESQGKSAYYALYGIERTSALAEISTIGNVDWFNRGLNYVVSTQAKDGSWADEYGVEAETSWCVLFLTRSTRKTIEKVKVKRLGAGTLLGGKGLPKDLSQLTIAQGRVVVKPMNGAIDEMLTVLEDPRTANAENALEGLLERYKKEGPKALKPYKDRFRASLKTPTKAYGLWLPGAFPGPRTSTSSPICPPPSWTRTRASSSRPESASNSFPAKSKASAHQALQPRKSAPKLRRSGASGSNRYVLQGSTAKTTLPIPP